MHHHKDRQFELLGLSGEYARQRIPLDRTGLIVGKDSRQANLILSDRLISRSHCRIFIEQGRAVIQDLHSSNGSYVNDRKLQPHQSVTLRHGDTISLAGSEEFRLIESQPPSLDSATVAVPSTRIPHERQTPVEHRVPQRAEKALNAGKLSAILLIPGGVLTSGSIVWWALFYGKLINTIEDIENLVIGSIDNAFVREFFREWAQSLELSLSKVSGCLYSNAGVCSYANMIAKVFGNTPYTPVIFGMGISLLCMGTILYFILRRSE